MKSSSFFLFPIVEFLSRMALRARGFSLGFISTSYGNIHYFQKRARNEKAVLVFIHGIGASATHYARVFDPLHKLGYGIIALDLLGHGLSSDPGRQLSPDVLFQGFVEFIEKLNLPPFILIGNSLGGALSIRFALEYPKHLKKLILVSPAGGFQDEEEWEVFKKTIQIKSLEDSKFYLHKIYHQDPFYLPLFYSHFLEVMSRKGIQTLISECKFSDFDLLKKQKSENVFPPTLMIWGESERVFPKKHLERFKSLFPPQVIFDLPKQIGHCPQIENPVWFWKRIHAFVKENK